MVAHHNTGQPPDEREWSADRGGATNRNTGIRRTNESGLPAEAPLS